MRYSSSPFFIIFILFVAGTNIVKAQSHKDSLYAWHDKITGTENSELYNGPVYHNYEKTEKNHHRYWYKNTFSSGTVIFNGQLYTNVLLKYDIFEDELIIAQNEINSRLEIKSQKENISHFTIDNRKFVNIKGFSKNNEPIKGFYEENYTGKGISLYTKHFKKKRTVINNNQLLIEYDSGVTFLVNIEEQYSTIKSYKDLIKILPERKDDINSFYSSNSNFEKSDKIKFMKNLVLYLVNSSQTPTN
ncbi:hypothetical protein [Flavobacterium sp. H122]|uniref:hypothetical protein n=1 Tax=Flavobacterium sp. H122 TaxID=2529860 RepID=UPI0010AA9C33|nr:hypothetical protein [Flavobacterium sp. H122]